MLQSLAKTPGDSLDSVHHISEEPANLREHTDFTADSSLFITYPNNSLKVEKHAAQKPSPSGASDASAHDLKNEDARENASERSSAEALPESSRLSDVATDSELNALSGIQKVSIRAGETNVKHADVSELSLALHDRKHTTLDSHIQGMEPKPEHCVLQPLHGRTQPFSQLNSPFGTPLKTSRLFQRESLHSSTEIEPDFQNTSFLDDTRAQFDLDINIDEYQVFINQRQEFPWRNFRASNSARNSHRQTSLLSRRHISEASTAGASSTEKIEELSKQLTNCKIQLKLYEKFLQDLIDSQSIDVTEVTTFQLHLGHSTVSQRISNRTSSSIFQEPSPEKELLEMATLLEDLYASLEEYQGKWRDADNKVLTLNASIVAFAKDVSAALERVGFSTSNMDFNDFDDGPEEYLDRVLRRLRNSSMNNEVSRESSWKARYETPKAPCTSKEHQNTTPGHLETPRHNYEEADVTSLTLTPHRSHTSSVADDSIENKLQEYQAKIDRLQKEINDLKDQSGVGSMSDVSEHTYCSHGPRDREKHLLLQKDYENLRGAHDDLIDEHHRHKASLERTIASLRNQAEMLQKEKSALRNEVAGMANLQRELETSIERQRILTTEKIKLSYQVEALKKEKASLQTNIGRLTDRLATAAEKSTSSVDTLRKKADGASDLVDRLFHVDVGEFESLLKSFNKIADDNSLVDPRKKIDFMVSLVNTRLMDQQKKVLLSVEQAHKSVLGFFSRAVEVIVNDHIRLLLKDSEQKDGNENYVEELKQHIKTLEAKSKHVAERPEVTPSPRLKLRIEELTNRWKSEREARILENRRAKKRLHELGQEKKMGS